MQAGQKEREILGSPYKIQTALRVPTHSATGGAGCSPVLVGIGKHLGGISTSKYYTLIKR